jgi:hypothetical protein
MLIPNAENAVVDIRKLRDYCLNSEHNTGKHKARRYTLDFTLQWQNKSAVIRSGWIIEINSSIPHLTSCYPLT